MTYLGLVAVGWSFGWFCHFLFYSLYDKYIMEPSNQKLLDAKYKIGYHKGKIDLVEETKSDAEKTEELNKQLMEVIEEAKRNGPYRGQTN